MIKKRKWLWKNQNTNKRKKESLEDRFRLSLNYAFQLFDEGDYLGAISYFNTAESYQNIDGNLDLEVWKKKAQECDELIREGLKAEKEAKALSNNPDSRSLKKLYRIAFFNYCRLKKLNPKHPKIRQKVWRMRFKSR